MIRPAALLCLLASTALFSGCTSAPIAVYQVGADSGKTQSQLAGIRLVDQRSARQDGRLRVQMIIENRRGDEALLGYQNEWYDGSGFRVGTTSPWQPLRLGEGESETLEFIGPTESAATVELRLRDRDPIE